MKYCFLFSQTHLQKSMASLWPMRYKGKFARGTFGKIFFICNEMGKHG